MAITAAAISAEPRSWSTGPWKVQLINFSAASAAVGGTATADALSSVSHAIVTGVTQTAQPTYSGNVVTIAFVDPAATVHGQIVCYGR